MRKRSLLEGRRSVLAEAQTGSSLCNVKRIELAIESGHSKSGGHSTLPGQPTSTQRGCLAPLSRSLYLQGVFAFHTGLRGVRVSSVQIVPFLKHGKDLLPALPFVEAGIAVAHNLPAGGNGFGPRAQEQIAMPTAISAGRIIRFIVFFGVTAAYFMFT